MSSVPAVFLSVDSAIPVSTSTSAAISIATSIAGSSGSSDNSSPGGTTPANPVVDVDNLIFHVDLVFFALFAAFCLFTLPRAFAVLCRPSVFFGSLFLRRRPSSQPLEPLQREFSTARRVPQRNVSTKTTRSMGKTEESYTVDSHAHLLSMPRQGTQKSASYSVPTRVPSWITLTHPTIVSIVNYPLAPGLTFIKAFALVVVFGVLCYAAFYQSDPFTDPKRAGFIAMGIFPIVAALACKNNVFTWFSGVGYEKLNYLHRFAGHLVVLAANIHGIGFIYQWALDGSFYTHMQSPQIQWAFVTLGSLDLMYLGSREFVRKKSHTFFLITHLLGFGLAALGAVNHKNVTLPYISSGVLVYTLDRVLRVARMRVATGYVTPVPSLNGGTTHVHIPGLNRGFRAGQHVRVRIIDGQGFFPWVNTILFSRARPFSVASRPNGAGLELLIKKESGSFTTRLYDIAKADSKYSEKTKDVAQAEMGLPTHKVQFVVEGPYGGPSYTMFESYSGVLLVAGGSGISYTLSILDDLLAKHAAGQSRVRAIEVVWSVGDPSCVTALLPTLRPFLRPRPSPHSALAIRITVNYTRAPRGPLPDPERLPNGLNIQSGRLDALRSLETTVDHVLSVGLRFPGVAPTSGVVAACCGPPDLVEQVRTAVGQVSWERWRDVGGVENVSETFGF